MLEKLNGLLLGAEILAMIIGLFNVLAGNYSLAAADYGLAIYLRLVRVDS